MKAENERLREEIAELRRQFEKIAAIAASAADNTGCGECIDTYPATVAFKRWCTTKPR